MGPLRDRGERLVFSELFFGIDLHQSQAAKNGTSALALSAATKL